MTHVTTRRRAFLTLDAIAALVLLAALAAVLMSTIGQRHRVAMRLADTRDAARLAESALLDLQQNRKPDATVVVRPLNNVAGSDTLQWTQVAATVNGRTVTLVGATRRQP